MTLYKELEVGEKEKQIVNRLFHKLDRLTLDIFKPTDWKIMYLESRPFIDVDSFKYFMQFFTCINETGFEVLNYPLVEGERFIKFIKIPEFSEFDKIMEDNNFRYTGGVAYGSCLNWAMHSDPDNHILFFGYKEEFYSRVTDIFRSNDFVITRDKVKEIYDEHKEFLKGK